MGAWVFFYFLVVFFLFLGGGVGGWGFGVGVSGCDVVPVLWGHLGFFGLEE